MQWDPIYDNIGLGEGLVSSGNKPLFEPMLIKIHDTMWHH